jgi:hypothetical protein
LKYSNQIKLLAYIIPTFLAFEAIYRDWNIWTYPGVIKAFGNDWSYEHLKS